jgi:hypothetical protein
MSSYLRGGGYQTDKSLFSRYHLIKSQSQLKKRNQKKKWPVNFFLLTFESAKQTIFYLLFDGAVS